MRLRIGVGVTQEWVEQALPLLEEAGLRCVRQEVPPGGDGEYVECDFDFDGPGGLDPVTLSALVSRARACVEASMVPKMRIGFVPDAG